MLAPERAPDSARPVTNRNRSKATAERFMTATLSLINMTEDVGISSKRSADKMDNSEDRVGGSQR